MRECLERIFSERMSLQCHIPPGTSSPVTAPATKQRQSLLIITPAGRDLNAGPQWLAVV